MMADESKPGRKDAHNDQQQTLPVPEAECRKRVTQACNRCRMKKIKCTGEIPCPRCAADDAVCQFGIRRQSADKPVSLSYVNQLEVQQKILTQALKVIWKRYAPAEYHNPGGAEESIHGIVSQLGILDTNTDASPYNNSFSDSPASTRPPSQQQHRLPQTQGYNGPYVSIAARTAKDCIGPSTNNSSPQLDSSQGYRESSGQHPYGTMFRSAAAETSIEVPNETASYLERYLPTLSHCSSASVASSSGGDPSLYVPGLSDSMIPDGFVNGYFDQMGKEELQQAQTHAPEPRTGISFRRIHQAHGNACSRHGLDAGEGGIHYEVSAAESAHNCWLEPMTQDMQEAVWGISLYRGGGEEMYEEIWQDFLHEIPEAAHGLDWNIPAR